MIARIDVVTIVLLLAGLPWLARWFLGPARIAGSPGSCAPAGTRRSWP